MKNHIDIWYILSWYHIYRRLLSYYEYTCLAMFQSVLICGGLCGPILAFRLKEWTTHWSGFFTALETCHEVRNYILFKRSGTYILIFPACYIIHISSAAAYINTCCCGWQHNGERLSSETIQWVRLSIILPDYYCLQECYCRLYQKSWWYCTPWTTFWYCSSWWADEGQCLWVYHSLVGNLNIDKDVTMLSRTSQ